MEQPDGMEIDWRSGKVKRVRPWKKLYTYYDEEIGATVTRYAPARYVEDDYQLL